MLWGNTSFVNHLEVWTGLFSNFAQFFFKTYQNKAATFQTMDGHPTAEKDPIKIMPKRIGQIGQGLFH